MASWKQTSTRSLWLFASDTGVYYLHYMGRELAVWWPCPLSLSLHAKSSLLNTIWCILFVPPGEGTKIDFMCTVCTKMCYSNRRYESTVTDYCPFMNKIITKAINGEWPNFRINIEYFWIYVITYGFCYLNFTINSLITIYVILNAP